MSTGAHPSTGRREPSRPPQQRSVGQRLFGGAARAVEVAGHGLAWATRPLGRMWDSRKPLDRYALIHMASVAGDTLVGIALADSVFFSLPVGEAKIRVAEYLGLTMAPLALAAPALIPLLDRGGFRRTISFGAGVVRALVAILAAPHFHSLLLFPAAFVLLALSKVHGITKNGLTMAYSATEDSLVAANAKLGRLAAVAAVVAVGPGLLLLKFGRAPAVLVGAAFIYIVSALMTLRLPYPRSYFGRGEATRLGRLPSLAAPAAGAAGLKAASGFLLFLLAFALRDSGHPPYWFGLLAASATAGVFVGDLVAPRLPRNLREEAVVVGALIAAGVAALVAFQANTLPVLMLFACMAGAATEFGRLAFQSLMQRTAPGGAHGRVFVRYEMAFQLAWVVGAFLPAVLPIPFRWGILTLAGIYLLFGAAFLVKPRRAKRTDQAEPPPSPRGNEPRSPGV